MHWERSQLTYETVPYGKICIPFHTSSSIIMDGFQLVWEFTSYLLTFQYREDA